MEYAEKQKINWFKSELRSYYNSLPVAKNISDRIEELENIFNAHSPKLDDPPGRSVIEREHAMLRVIEKAERLKKKRAAFVSQDERVKEILDYMPEKMRKIIIEVYSGRCNIDYVAFRENYSFDAMRWNIDKAILEAVECYEKEEK